MRGLLAKVRGEGERLRWREEVVMGLCSVHRDLGTVTHLEQITAFISVLNGNPNPRAFKCQQPQPNLPAFPGERRFEEGPGVIVRREG